MNCGKKSGAWNSTHIKKFICGNKAEIYNKVHGKNEWINDIQESDKQG